tara:strand:+ start:6063 stop:7190 length:1128 start_codon:yes stop_codon:yes gene_type:complete
VKKKYFLFEPVLGKEELKNLSYCIKSNWISSNGKFVDEFERNFSKYLGGGYAVAVSNGTTAIELALASLGIKKGDEVIVPNFTFAATINAVINIGAKPVLVDCDTETWTIDLNKVSKVISKKTKALLPVHIYGQPSKIDEIIDFAKRKKLLVVEDCAEALGSTYKKRKVGLDGHCTTFSFFPNKVITTGEGGMAVFKKLKDSLKARILLNQGRSIKKTYWHDFAGFNFRMTNLQAAVGVAQLKKIDFFLKKRRQIFENYNKLFKNDSFVSLLPSNNWSTNSYWIYTILIRNIGEKKRDKLMKILGLKGIETRPGFYPLNTMRPYAKYGKGSYPVSKKIGVNSISIPTSINLTVKDQEYIYNKIIDSIKKIMKVKN